MRGHDWLSKSWQVTEPSWPLKGYSFILLLAAFENDRDVVVCVSAYV